MFKPAVFSLFFLLLSNSAFLGKENKPLKSDYNFNSQDFWDNLRVVPVQFTEKKSDEAGNIHFSATFASNVVVKDVSFVLPSQPIPQEAFFEQNKDWEEKIDRKEFLKKFKKDFWLATYLKEGQENVIISAHQFKQWQAIKATYAGNLDHLRRNVDIPDFWDDLRVKFVFFYKIKEEKAYWLSVNQVEKNEPLTEDDKKMLNLGGGGMIRQRTKDLEGNEFRVVSQGVFYLQKNTIFHKQEIENSKAKKMLKFTITDARLRLRPVVLDLGYFLKNTATHNWICFYDSKYESLSRVIEAADDSTENSSKK